MGYGGDVLNPVLIFLIIFLAVIIWFVLSFMFVPIGRLIVRIITNTHKKIIYKEGTDEDENKDK